MSTEGRAEQFARELLEPGKRLTIKEAAETSGLSDKTIRRWIESGRLQAQKYAGRWNTTRAEMSVALFGEKQDEPKTRPIDGDLNQFASLEHQKGVNPLGDEGKRGLQNRSASFGLGLESTYNRLTGRDFVERRIE